MTNNEPGNLTANSADLVLLNGFVYTQDAESPTAEAIALRDGRILALGTTSAIRDLCGANTRVIDLDGRMVMPGLIDGHCHPTKGAIANLFSCKFEFTATPADIAQILADHIARDPHCACIIGGRWDSGFFETYSLPSPRAWLDEHSGNTPVYLRDDSGHNGWANSLALQLIGVDRHSTDPPGGKIIRDALSGEPNGLLFEAADTQARSRLSDWSMAQYMAGVREMVRIANAYGITGVTDADASEPLLAAYQSVAESGALKVHVVASISTPFGPRDGPLDYAHIEALRDRYGAPNVDTRFAKIYEDGVPTAARTAAMLQPYRTDARFPAGYRGALHVDEATLSHDMAELEKRGFTVKIHTAGDRAVRTALNAIENAHAISGRSDLRHELAHAGFVDESDIVRFKQLNAVADLSPYIWHPSPIMRSIVDAVGARGEHYWPIRDLLESGASLLAGSDWPAAVSSMDPWRGIAAMVTRRDPRGTTTGALWPEQAISLEQALKIFTLDGARAQRRDATAGSLTVGKTADLVVLDQNLFAIPPDAIANTLVDMTVFAGEVVYTK
jgi:predicted amidohydrolase YtcJ